MKLSDRPVVIITGSSGFIGSALVRKLSGVFDLVGFDRIASRAPPPEAECVCIDLTSEEGVKGAFDRLRIAYGNRIASVIHLAAYYDLSGEPSPLYESITVGGTERLLAHLKDFEVEQFIFSSTLLVHAPTKPGHPINEEWLIDPRWPYPMSKVETEAKIRDRHGNIPIVSLRLAGVYTDEGRNAFLSQQIARIYERRLLSLLYPGDPAHGQPFLHLEDACDGIVRLIERRKELPSDLVLLLGEPETMSYDEVQRTTAKLLHGEEWHTKQVPKLMAKAGAWLEDEVLDEEPFIKPWMVDFADDHYELDIGKARKLLGWEPRFSLRGSLPTIIDNLKADTARWYRENKLNDALVAGDAAALGGGQPEKSPEARMVEQVALQQRVSREHENMMKSERRTTRWAHFVNIALGAWLVTSAFAFGLFEHVSFDFAILQVTEDRALAPPDWRSAILGRSDVIAGLLIMIFGALSLSRRSNWAQWANVVVGLWLLFAPLVFWAPSAAAYNNDLIVGMLVITFAVLVPMMPGMSMEGMMDSTSVPPGWTYCPSTSAQRLPVAAMGLVGLLIARQLTAYQLGHVQAVWDPFFGGAGGLNGTETIITSDVSKAWPIPDAGLGAVAYALEILMACMGGRARWRTMPWMVTFFGILVVPLGAISIYFIIIQPIIIGTWCALCLLAALAMLVMIPFSLDELIAMGQFLVWSRRAGKPFWRTFFMGDAMPGGSDVGGDDLASPKAALADMIRGVTLPWTLATSAILGVSLMFTRLTFGTAGAMADSDHVVGALVVTTAIIATAEVARPLRFVIAGCGLWLIVAPWILAGGSSAAAWASVFLGVILIALSAPRGKRSREHYAGWDDYVV